MAAAKLIQLVKERPAIWQVSDKRYKDKSARERAWKEIAKEIGKDDLMIRKRWKNLKDAFRKELKRVLVQDIEASSWQHFEQLSFITEAILKGIRNKDINALSTEETADGDSDDPLSVKTEIPEAEPSTSMDGNSTLEISYANDDSMSHLANRNLNVMQHNNKRKALEDEYDADYMFLVSLLPTMRQLSEIQKLQFRGKVNQWLLEAVSQDYNQPYKRKLDVESDDSFE
ncbi:uncharacterized protein LOC120624438 [Pararge aegeria]|uniref:Jg18870 protein n=1 Tax=Pararge aegeria aegeria TaxID=348720 RepID=A0A8S4RSG0_9NEOP|nr:uncharacterized protein LOC120624438 [Pararge aegeria]CAH2240831.1 jg18870 [Pararge aegeria aegeria]